MNRALSIAGLVIAILICAVCLFHIKGNVPPQAKPSPATSGDKKRSSSEQHRMPKEDGASGAVQGEGAQRDAGLEVQADGCKRAEEIVGNMLTLQPGHVSRKQSLDYISEIKALSTNALPMVKSLLVSSNQTDHLLGVYLALETQGMTNEVVDSVISDPSPYVQAEAAEILFLHEGFEARERLLKSVADGLTPQGVQTLLSLLDRTPSRLQVPAAMANLYIGEALHPWIASLLGENDSLRQMSLGQLMAKTDSPPRRQNLLEILVSSGRCDYRDLLVPLIQDQADNPVLRLEALRWLKESVSDKKDVAFLQDYANSHPDDPLSKMMLRARDNILHRLQSRTCATAQEVEASLTQTLSSPTPQKEGIASTVGAYLAMIRRGEVTTPNASLLKQIDEYLEKTWRNVERPPRVKAEVAYLLWSVADVSGRRN